MKKRFITTSLIGFLISTVVYAAPPGVTVSIPDKTKLTDDMYTVTVTMNENPGFSAAQIELSYNKDVLGCQKVVPGEVLSGMLTDTNPAANGDKTSAILSAAATENVTAIGTLASFVFDKPKDGDPEFELTAFELTSADGKKLDLNIDIQNNYGEIKKDPEQTPTDTDKPSQGGSSGGGHGSSKPSGGTITIQPIDKPKEENAKTFTDVTDAHWAKEYIEKAAAMGIVSGYENGTFLPDSEMTRAEFATILWNVAGKPDKSAKPNFTDVSETDWFYKQIAWAYGEGYISGVSDTEFSPNSNITREQAMTILYRYKGSPDTENAIGKFADKSDVSEYAENAMSWAALNNIISGTSENTLSPKMNATRAQLATIMIRFINTNN